MYYAALLGLDLVISYFIRGKPQGGLSELCSSEFSEPVGIQEYCRSTLQATSAGVQLLPNKTIDVNAQGGYYRTALAAASGQGHKKVVEQLLDAGANVNTQANNEGDMALHAASRNRHADVVQLLLEKEADTEVADSNRKTVLYIASRRGHANIVQLLLEKGANTVGIYDF